MKFTTQIKDLALHKKNTHTAAWWRSSQDLKNAVNYVTENQEEVGKLLLFH